MKITHTPRLHVLNLMINICIIALGLYSCNEPAKSKDKVNIKNDYDLISTYFKEQHHYALTDSINTIFILTDVGCMPCNKHFSELMTNYLNDPGSIFLILASGTNIDLSSYTGSKHAIFYGEPENIKNNILKQSKAIFIRNKQIDTTIIIDARQIEIQFQKITTKKSAENLTKETE